MFVKSIIKTVLKQKTAVNFNPLMLILIRLNSFIQSKINWDMKMYIFLNLKKYFINYVFFNVVGQNSCSLSRKIM